MENLTVKVKILVFLYINCINRFLFRNYIEFKQFITRGYGRELLMSMYDDTYDTI